MTAETMNPVHNVSALHQPAQFGDDDESRGDRSTTTIASKALMLGGNDLRGLAQQTNQSSSPPISCMKINEPSVQDTLSRQGKADQSPAKPTAVD